VRASGSLSAGQTRATARGWPNECARCVSLGVSSRPDADENRPRNNFNHLVLRFAGLRPAARNRARPPAAQTLPEQMLVKCRHASRGDADLEPVRRRRVRWWT